MKHLGLMVAAALTLPIAGSALATTPKAAPAEKATTEDNLLSMAAALSVDHVVMVDFSAKWCGWCHLLSPLLEEVTVESEGEVAMVTVDIDEHPELARAKDVHAYPTVLIMASGRVVDRFEGAVNKKELLKRLAHVRRIR